MPLSMARSLNPPRPEPGMAAAVLQDSSLKSLCAHHHGVDQASGGPCSGLFPGSQEESQPPGGTHANIASNSAGQGIESIAHSEAWLAGLSTMRPQDSQLEPQCGRWRTVRSKGVLPASTAVASCEHVACSLPQCDRGNSRLCVAGQGRTSLMSGP